MSIYKKIAYFLTGYDVRIVTEEVVNNNFANILINRFEHLYTNLNFKLKSKQEGFLVISNARIDGTRVLKNHEKVTTINHHIQSEVEDDLAIETPNSIIYLIDNKVIFKNVLAIQEAFEYNAVGFKLAFLLSKRTHMKLRKEDLGKPSEKACDDAMKHMLKETFGNLRRCNYDRKIQNLMRKKNDYEESIRKQQDKLVEVDEELRVVENNALFKNALEDPSPIIDYVMKNNAINKHSIKARIIEEQVAAQLVDKRVHLITMETHDLEAIKINRAYLEKSKGSIFAAYPKFRKHLNDIISGDSKILVGRYFITIELKEDIMNLDYHPLDNRYQNPHAKIRCMGTANVPYNEALANKDILTALGILLEYLQSINFGDGIGSSNTPKTCRLVKEGEIVYEPETV